MKANEEKEKHDEMMERFRLYGEIFILCQENGIDIDYYNIEDDEWEDGYGIEQTFEVTCDDGEGGKMNTIRFDDGMLAVGYKNILAPFFEVTSETLESVLFIMNTVIEDQV